MPIFEDEKEDKRVEFLRRQEEEDLARILSEKYGLQYTDLSLVSINSDALRLIPEEEARNAEIAAFGRIGKKVNVGARAPKNSKAQTSVTKLEELGYQVTMYMVSGESLKRAWDRYKDLSYATESKAGVFEIGGEELEKLLPKIRGVRDVGVLINEAITLKRAYRITRILEIALAGALSLKASDVHFE